MYTWPQDIQRRHLGVRSLVPNTNKPVGNPCHFGNGGYRLMS